MVADGIIRAFPVLIYGRSEVDSTYAIEDALGVHELVYWGAQAGGNYVYVGRISGIYRSSRVTWSS